MIFFLELPWTLNFHNTREQICIKIKIEHFLKFSIETFFENFSRFKKKLTLDIKFVIKDCRHGFIVELGHKKKKK